MSEIKEVSNRFRKMADDIERNPDNFGGAAVIVSPSAPGVTEQSIEVLILDASGDAAQFFSTVVTRIQLMTRAMDEKRATQQWNVR